MGEYQGRAVIDVEALLLPVWDIGGEVDVEKGRFVGSLDPEAAGDLSVRLGKNIKATAEQGLVGFNPRKIITVGEEHR